MRPDDQRPDEQRLARMGSIDRRRFLGLSGTTAAGVVLGAGPYTERALAAPRFSDDPFSLGVASGDPLPDGIVLWTRLAPRPLADDGKGGMPDRKVEVRWEVASDERFRRVVRRGRTVARPELGHSVHVEVGGLRPAREYHYRFVVGSDVSPVGRTKTAPAFGSTVSELNFAFASCQQYEHGYFNAYRAMAKEDLDLVIHLGDYIYEYEAGDYVAPAGNVRQHKGGEITTLADYRQRHAQYRTDRDLQAAHAAFPFIVTWDDHEVDNNYADEIPEDGNSPLGFLKRRANAYQAYYENMPLRRSSVPRGPDMLLYRRLSYGTLAEFSVLDTRQYRDDQANGDGTKAPSPESTDPSRTLTGNRQERWLLNGLAESDATWNVLAQQVFYARQDRTFGTGETFSMDAWDGYPASRERISSFIAEQGVANPVVLTGDVHANWGNDILRDFEDPGSEVIATEFVGTSITSGGDGSDVRADTAQTLAENPHIRFFNNQRGYVRCRLTAGEWSSDYRVVPYVTQPGGQVATRATLTTEAGSPGISEVAEGRVTAPRRRSSEVEADRLRAQLTD
ncbi:twin-arginine translocation signal domain-containing protein [Thermoleophilia bacterium SCSIO 60948]|nr:twin-arginine translocation signal domain-containing protein [Thermoleophilia bacterium SCSIO 60948]